jgi:light-regulated signal transduction histidine kinase (bacteriophytochrome)
MLNSTLTHEMMQPLSCIVYFSEKFSKGRLDKQSKRMIQMITSASKLLRCQMKDLMDRNLLNNGSLQLN